MAELKAGKHPETEREETLFRHGNRGFALRQIEKWWRSKAGVSNTEKTD